MTWRTWIFGGAAGLAACVAISFGAGPAPAPTPVRIGLVETLFRDVPQLLIPIGLRPMKELMVGQTGVNGDLIPCGNADSLARQLKSNEVQLALFHGPEFAWIHQNYPTLKPLVIIVNERPFLRAQLIVRADSKAAGAADLKGKAIDLARSQEHCRLFLERRLCPAGTEPGAYFSSVEVQWSAEDALDDVLNENVQAAVVDEVSLEAYRKSKPGCAAKLKMLQQSEVFPCAVIAYQPGDLGAATLDAFRDGLIAAKDSPKAKSLLRSNRITGFEAVPSDYEKMLQDSAKAYPPPAAK
jgi:ABC-type phosphate/phosphonate transport system substrate-binding protein